MATNPLADRCILKNLPKPVKKIQVNERQFLTFYSTKELIPSGSIGDFKMNDDWLVSIQSADDFFDSVNYVQKNNGNSKLTNYEKNKNNVDKRDESLTTPRFKDHKCHSKELHHQFYSL